MNESFPIVFKIQKIMGSYTTEINNGSNPSQKSESTEETKNEKKGKISFVLLYVIFLGFLLLFPISVIVWIILDNSCDPVLKSFLIRNLAGMLYVLLLGVMTIVLLRRKGLNEIRLWQDKLELVFPNKTRLVPYNTIKAISYKKIRDEGMEWNELFVSLPMNSIFRWESISWEVEKIYYTLCKLAFPTMIKILEKEPSIIFKRRDYPAHSLKTIFGGIVLLFLASAGVFFIQGALNEIVYLLVIFIIGITLFYGFVLFFSWKDNISQKDGVLLTKTGLFSL
ncbi:MAG: hypothetical protein AABZ60_02370 [Planctomycetota bacterium]